MIGEQQSEEAHGEKKSKFLKELTISNFRIFPYQKREADCFKIEFNVPDGKTPGSGLTVILGNNNCGKTTLLRAILATRIGRNDLNIGAPTKPFFLRKDNLTIKIDLRSVAASDILEEQQTPCSFIHNFQEQHALGRGMFVARNWLQSADAEVNRTIANFTKDVFDTILVANDFLRKKFNTIVEPGINGRDDWDYIERKGTKAIDMLRIGDGTLQAGFVVGNLISKNNIQPLLLSDEPDTHVDASHLSDLATELLEISAKKQVIITTHSSTLVRGIVCCLYAAGQSENRGTQNFLKKRFKILTRTAKKPVSLKMEIDDLCLIPKISANEINYVAFDITSQSYYLELYDHFIESIKPEIEQERQKLKQSKEAEIRESVIEEKAKITNTEIGKRKKPYNETLFTYLRNAICHPENKERSYEEKELREYIEKLREVLKNLKKESNNSKKAH